MTHAAPGDGEAQADRLLEAALNHVPIDGWSEAALAAGARDLGIDRGQARRAFPRGGIGLVIRFSDWADRRMEAALGALDLERMKRRERIAAAVRARLEALDDDREAVRLALGLLALPVHGPDALACLYRTVDSAWRAVGDRSADFNFYTKRALLAGVQLSTTLYWLADESEDHAETWAFLDRRIADVLSIQKARGRLERLGPALLRRLRRGVGRPPGAAGRGR